MVDLPAMLTCVHLHIFTYVCMFLHALLAVPACPMCMELHACAHSRVPPCPTPALCSLAAIDLLEALTASRAIPGVSPAPGPTPGTPAWRFGRRTPHLTLPRAYAVFVLASAPRALGFHAVARQSPRSQGTLLALLSPTARSPLLHLASSARGDELRLDYRAAPSGHPASLVFPGGSPFAGGRWVRLALSLAPHRLALYADCRPAVVLGQAGHRPRLSLHLPLDLQIAFASLPGDADSKFLVSPCLPCASVPAALPGPFPEPWAWPLRRGGFCLDPHAPPSQASSTTGAPSSAHAPKLPPPHSHSGPLICNWWLLRGV